MKGEISHKLQFETIILKKVFNPDAEEFQTQLFKVKVEFDPETYMKTNQCAICGMDFKRHEFKTLHGLVIEVCKPQQTTFGAIPVFETGKPLGWVKVLSETKMTKGEAVQFIKANKIVQSPQITIFLLR
jgi:hypothetical protein